MLEDPHRERLKALGMPLFIAVGTAAELQKVPAQFISTLLNPAPSPETDIALRPSGITTARSQNQDWHSKIIEVGSVLGISERRSSDEIIRDLEIIFDIPGSPEPEKGLAAIAGKLGLENSSSPYILLLESIGAKLDVPKEYFFDESLYYAKAEQCWIEGIAKRLGISLCRSDQEILLRVGEKLGVDFTSVEKSEAAILQRISVTLDVSSTGDLMATLNRVESAIRDRRFVGTR